MTEHEQELLLMATAPASTAPATLGTLAQLSAVILQAFREKFAQRDARIEVLESRLAQLEAAPYEAGRAYGKGTFATYDGSLWRANYKTASRPGEGPAWTMNGNAR